jgi:moderate conductance mechanosensitive channel
MADETAAGYLDARIDALREHVVSLIAAVPSLPAQFGRVRDQLAQEWQANGPGYVFGLIAAFILLGLALEALYRYLFPRIGGDRLRTTALGFARDAGAVAVFTLGSVAAFLSFNWPPRIRQAVVAFLAALIVVRLVIVASRTIFSPRDAALRILPSSDAEALARHRRIVLFVGWLAFGWVLFTWLTLLGMDLPSRQIVVYLLGLVLLAIAVQAVWQRSRLVAVGFVVAWLFWVLQARGLFWLAVVAATLPGVLRLTQVGVDHALRPPGTAVADTRGMLAAALGRALRALVIIGAAWLLVLAFGLDVNALASGETVWMRLVRGAVNALAIILLADVIWLVAASLIDQKMSSAQEANARLRTLLPIVRGSVAVILVVMTVLMALSVLGVQVGPLLASAGVIGIAVGFGAQTLVRDLFSKFFYLLDDAFRVGEYIQSGNYKGTVEQLGARSIRLRHHRGPVYTIPYGQLGAVQNMSRDWVIDKLTINLSYSADLEKAKKLIKQIGKELQANPEFAPAILEPLKMQGVEAFGDFAITIRMKMMTKPGQQFTIRRRAYSMMRAAFAANGIEFAVPTVQVAGGGAADPAAVAAVRQSMELNKASGGT